MILLKITPQNTVNNTYKNIGSINQQVKLPKIRPESAINNIYNKIGSVTTAGENVKNNTQKLCRHYL